jgi:hypothetical protein
MQLSVKRKTRAQSIIETVVGIIFMIPIVLFLFDIVVLTLAGTANDNLAKQAARAAASAVDPSTSLGTPAVAQTAAIHIVSSFATSGFIDKVQLAFMDYDATPTGANTATPVQSGLGAPPSTANIDPGPGNVSVVIGMEARAPVPFPGFDTTRTFWARAVEPIVSLPPSN